MNQPAQKLTVSQQTREELILAAERLFSEFGIDAVSLRQINAAAGQRNSSAAHYHFGSKDALIAATLVFAYGCGGDAGVVVIDFTKTEAVERPQARSPESPFFRVAVFVDGSTTQVFCPSQSNVSPHNSSPTSSTCPDSASCNSAHGL